MPQKLDALRTARAKDTAQKKARVQRVVKQLIQNGDKVTIAEVCRRAKVSAAFVYEGCGGEIRILVEKARAISQGEISEGLKEVSSEMATAPMDLSKIMTHIQVLQARVEQNNAVLHELIEEARSANNHGRLLFTPHDVCGILDIDSTQLGKLIGRRHLICLRIEGRDFITASSLSAYVGRVRGAH